MKLIKTISVLAIFASVSAFAKEPENYTVSEPRKTVSFNGKFYEFEWVSNFDSYQDFRNKWTPPVWWYDRGVSMDRTTAINAITAVDGIAPNMEYTEKDNFKYCFFDSNYSPQKIYKKSTLPTV